MSQTRGFESGDRNAETLRRGAELNALAEPKGLEVRVNHLVNDASGASQFRADRLEIFFEVFNVRQKGHPEDRGRSLSFDEAKAYIAAQPDART